MMNPVKTISGFLARDPEFKTTNSGKEIAKFSVGARTGKKLDDGKDEVIWVGVTLWEKDVQMASGLKKGSRVAVYGPMKTTEGDQGRTFYDISAWDLYEKIWPPRDDYERPRQPMPGQQAADDPFSFGPASSDDFGGEEAPF